VVQRWQARCLGVVTSHEDARELRIECCRQACINTALSCDRHECDPEPGAHAPVIMCGDDRDQVRGWVATSGREQGECLRSGAFLPVRRVGTRPRDRGGPNVFEHAEHRGGRNARPGVASVDAQLLGNGPRDLRQDSLHSRRGQGSEIGVSGEHPVRQVEGVRIEPAQLRA
jgi:hypothetical protein